MTFSLFPFHVSTSFWSLWKIDALSENVVVFVFNRQKGETFNSGNQKSLIIALCVCLCCHANEHTVLHTTYKNRIQDELKKKMVRREKKCNLNKKYGKYSCHFNCYFKNYELKINKILFGLGAYQWNETKKKIEEDETFKKDETRSD